MHHVRGRFAPSPSGQMHLGNVWTALLAWLSVRKAGGEMILRMEDLDPERSRPAFAEQILTDLRWLGLDWDEGPDIGGPFAPYSQDDRRELYKQAIDKLTLSGLVYPCFCSRAELHSPTLAPHAGETEWRYPGTCKLLGDQQRLFRMQQGKRPLLRVAVPDKNYTFTDGIQGVFTQNLHTACGDFVVQRSDGVHAYQLAVVVDDALMSISQVVRGSDLLASTVKQLYLYEILELPPPAFAHVPLLIDQSGQRLSKRQQSLTLSALRQKGVKAERIIGYLAWRAGLIEYDESVAARDLVVDFSLHRISRAPVLIDIIPN